MGAYLWAMDDEHSTILHDAAYGGDLECITWVFRHLAIDVNVTNGMNETPIMWATNSDAVKLLVEKGANVFARNNVDKINLDLAFGPAGLQHAKDLIWVSVKPLLCLFNACSSDVVPVDPSVVIPTSFISVFGNSDLTRHIAAFIQRRDIISIDPDDDEEKEPDEVKRRVEAVARQRY
jgi:hypothetical protein